MCLLMIGNDWLLTVYSAKRKNDKHFRKQVGRWYMYIKAYFKAIRKATM